MLFALSIGSCRREVRTTLPDKSSLSSLIIGLRCRPGCAAQELARSAHQPGLVRAALSSSASTALTIPGAAKHAENRAPLAGLLGWHAERDSERLASMTSAVRFASIVSCCALGPRRCGPCALAGEPPRCGPQFLLLIAAYAAGRIAIGAAQNSITQYRGAPGSGCSRLISRHPDRWPLAHRCKCRMIPLFPTAQTSVPA